MYSELVFALTLTIKRAILRAMTDKRKKIIIEGVTEGGETFRPSNWAERVSGRLSTYDRRGIHYSPMVQPSTQNGNRCVILDEALKEDNPAAYQDILAFARKNKLKICGDDNGDLE
jgi:hypothetical protein